MTEIGKITTVYSSEEDRISLTAITRDSQMVRIWLTQRLVNRLIPALVNVVTPKHDDRAYAEILAGMSHCRAIDRKEPVAPVRANEPCEQWLAAQIDVQILTSGTILIFSGPNGQAAKLPLNPDALRQWLSILRRAYDAAEWCGTTWPDWISMVHSRPAVGKVLH